MNKCRNQQISSGLCALLQSHHGQHQTSRYDMFPRQPFTYLAEIQASFQNIRLNIDAKNRFRVHMIIMSQDSMNEKSASGAIQYNDTPKPSARTHAVNPTAPLAGAELESDRGPSLMKLYIYIIIRITQSGRWQYTAIHPSFRDMNY
jgi:hypothetical protein